MKHPLQAVFLVLVLAAAGQAVWQHPRLPERVAIHFDASGHANAWASRGAQTAWHLGTVLFMAALIEGIVFAQARLPAKMINLPNRDLWFAPERAAATRAWLVGAGLRMGCALMVFFLGIFHLAYRANLSRPPRLTPAVWWLAGGLVVVIFGLLTGLVLRFSRKPVV